MVLLVTYHFGDAAGRQWHEAMGVLAFFVALGMLLGLEAALWHVGHRLRSERA
jgi:hypothetical protein